MKELVLIILALDVITEIFCIRRLEEEIEKQKTINVKLNDDLDLANLRAEQKNNIIKDLQDKNKELISDFQSQN